MMRLKFWVRIKAAKRKNLSPDIIGSNTIYLVPDANLYMFGIMTSNIHMSWARAFRGRLKSDYRYTSAVYSNFLWPTPTGAQKAKIDPTEQSILDARALYPDSSLKPLDPDTAPRYMKYIPAWA